MHKDEFMAAPAAAEAEAAAEAVSQAELRHLQRRRRRELAGSQDEQVWQVLQGLRAAVGRLNTRLKAVEEARLAHTHHAGGVAVGPPVRNGVHVDRAGRYWMRRPDGWHRMQIQENAARYPLIEFPVQRLAEPRDG